MVVAFTLPHQHRQLPLTISSMLLCRVCLVHTLSGSRSPDSPYGLDSLLIRILYLLILFARWISEIAGSWSALSGETNTPIMFWFTIARLLHLLHTLPVQWMIYHKKFTIYYLLLKISITYTHKYCSKNCLLCKFVSDEQRKLNSGFPAVIDTCRGSTNWAI